MQLRKRLWFGFCIKAQMRVWFPVSGIEMVEREEMRGKIEIKIIIE